MKAERNFELEILIFGLLVVGLFGFLRLEQAIASWQRLSQSGLLLPIYLSTSGAIAGILGVIAALSLWLRRPWAARLVRWGVLGLGVGYWVERLVLWRSPTSQVNLPFSAVITAVLLFYAFGTLRLQSRRENLSIRGKNHERTGN